MKNLGWVLAFVLSFSGIQGPSAAWAASRSVTVSTGEAMLYASPSSSGAPVGRVKRGQLLQADGPPQSGFQKLVTKSRKPLWIKTSDLTRTSPPSAEDDLVMAASPTSRSERPFKRFTYDFGVSTGISSGGSSSYEINLGLNYFFTEWLSWRNAPFFNLRSGSTSYYGLDSSIRGTYRPELGSGFSPAVMLGAGYRVASYGKSAPFGEAGLLLRMSGLNVGASVKVVLDSWVREGAQNEVYLSLQLAGGGAL